MVERAVQTVEGQIRVMKLALEFRLGMQVPVGANVVAFMAEYASYLINRLEVGKDGKTAAERNKGKTASVMGVEFGEKVMYKKRFKTKMAKIEPRWEKGIFVGIRVQSGEFWVATSGGVKKTRSVRRLAPQDRWSEDSMKWVRHVPWHLYRGDEGADGDIPEEQLVDAGGREEGRTEGGIARDSWRGHNGEDASSGTPSISHQEGGRREAWLYERMRRVLVVVPGLGPAAALG